MDYQLKPATSENEQQFYDLMRENCAEVGMGYDDFHEGYQLEVSCGQALLFYHGGKPVGAAILSSNDETRASGLSDIYIVQSQRGAGHGKNLVSSCESLAAHFGKKSMFLICELDRISFYKELGYQEDKQDGKHYFLKKSLSP